MSAPARFDRAVQHSNAKVALLGQGVIVLLEVARVDSSPSSHFFYRGGIAGWRGPSQFIVLNSCCVIISFVLCSLGLIMMFAVCFHFNISYQS